MNGHIRKTVNIVELLQLVDIWSEKGNSSPLPLRDTFINCPVDAVRLKCIEGLRDAFGAGVLSEWAIDTVRGLFKVDDAPMARNLWIAFSDAVSTGVSLAVKNFHVPPSRKQQEESARKGLLLSLKDDKSWKAWVMSLQLVAEFWREELATAVKCACMLSKILNPADVADIYAPALHFDILRESLEHALLRLAILNYDESDWHIAKRVLVLIYKMNETSFIPLVRMLVESHERFVSDGSVASWSRLQNRVILQEVLQHLEEPVAEKS